MSERGSCCKLLFLSECHRKCHSIFNIFQVTAFTWNPEDKHVSRIGIQVTTGSLHNILFVFWCRADKNECYSALVVLYIAVCLYFYVKKMV